MVIKLGQIKRLSAKCNFWGGVTRTATIKLEEDSKGEKGAI